jgi:hypothetical protein
MCLWAAVSLCIVCPFDKQGVVQGDARLDVWSEVVQPFHLMPRFALEGTSNAVMDALVGSLLPRFMDRSNFSFLSP